MEQIVIVKNSSRRRRGCVGFFQTFRRLSSMEAVLAGKSLKPTTRGVRSGIRNSGSGTLLTQFSYFDKLSYIPDHTCHYFVFKIHKLYKLWRRGGSWAGQQRVACGPLPVTIFAHEIILMLRRVQFWKEGEGRASTTPGQNYVQHRGSPTKMMEFWVEW